MSDTGKAETPDGQAVPVVIRIIDKLSNVFAVGATLGLGMLAINVMLDVVGRTLFHAPFAGTLEMTSYWWMPSLTLLAFAYTEKQQEHIKVTILLDALPIRLRQFVEAAFGVIATGLLLALTYYTFREALSAAALQKTTPSKPPIAIWPFMLVAVAGVGMLTLQTVATTYRFFAGHLPRRDEIEAEAKP